MYRVRRAIAATALASVAVASVFASGMLAGGQAGSASAGAAAREPFLVRQHGFPLPLVVRGDRVEIGYRAQRGPNLGQTPSASGTLYVSNDLRRSFTAVPLEIRKTAEARGLWALVPERLLAGHRLFYYGVIRDRLNGRVVTVPAGGARAPETTLIVNGAFRVGLATHVFGHPRSSEAVVARAGPAEVGFGMNQLGFGPSAFDVAKDHSVWLLDRVNQRVLVWALGHPDTIARTVALPSPFLFGGDFAVGPVGSLYVIRGGIPGSPLNRLSRVSASGKVLWTGRIPGNLYLRTGPDGTLYSTGPGPNLSPRSMWGNYPWVPVATPGGRPLSLATQQRRTLWAQPLPGGVELVRVNAGYDKRYSPHEARLALIDRSGRVVRAWRVSSRTAIPMSWGATPALVGGDPVIVLLATGPDQKQEYLVLRLGPKGGVRTHFALPANDPPHSAYGDSVSTEIRVQPDGKLYQLGSAPDFGAAIYRFSLRPAR